MMEYFNSNNPDNLTANKIVDDLNINLNSLDSSYIEVICRHLTTTNADNLNSFYEYGLLDLKSMLCLKTPLSIFLNENGVTVNIDGKTILINSDKYPITQYNEPCTYCYRENSTTCNGYGKCKLRESLDTLGMKLYKYDATLEFFINAPLEHMQSYSTVFHYPEILYTIKRIAENSKNPKHICNICSEWVEKYSNRYILEFTAKLSEMESFVP